MSSFPSSSSVLLVVLAGSVAACGDPVEPALDAAAPSADAFAADAAPALDALVEGDDAFLAVDAPLVLDAPSALDAFAADDAFMASDALTASDAFASSDAFVGPDAFSADDAPITRRSLIADFCPSTTTSAGLYRGTLASNLNDIAGACTVTAPGRDGSVRVMLAPGQSLTATYRHAGDGIVYLLERCPVVASCVASADASSSGAETLRYTNSGSAAAPYYLVLDSDSTGGPQTFELDLEITP